MNKTIETYNTALEMENVELKKLLINSDHNREELHNRNKSLVERLDTLQISYQRMVCDRQESPTLRDMFAMAALTGMLSNTDVDLSKSGRIPAVCYDFADAMLKQREEGRE